MDLNNIQLPASLVSSLYEHSLISSVVEKDPEPAVSMAKEAPAVSASEAWKYLGENKKSILIIVNNPDVVHMPDNELALLTTILSACKLSLADVAVFNRNNQPLVLFREMAAFFKPRIVFLFGVDPVSIGLPVSFPQFQIQSFDKATFLFSPSLDEVQNDSLVKSKLWVCLRRIFII